MSRKQQRRLNQPGGRSKANRQHQAESEGQAPALAMEADEEPEEAMMMVESQQLPSEDAWARKMHSLASE